ncbi:MAG TPA: urea amidolyase associated protein UAAP1 [Jatrophihabitantaceae bacterium]
MSPLLSHDVPGGAAWSVLLRAGRAMRLTALDAGANASTLIFAAHNRVDRLNVPDTLKAQMSARVRPPMVLMSDRGVGLCSITGSSLDWHDAVCGHSLDGHVDAFGPSSYGRDRNEWRRSARSGFLSELRKHGLGETDLHGCVNFFSRVATHDDGSLTFVPGHASDGDWVELRAEIDLLVVISTAPHPLATGWAPAAVRAEVHSSTPYGPDDPSMTFRDESARALLAAQAVFA